MGHMERNTVMNRDGRNYKIMHIATEDAVFVDKTLYFFSKNLNALYKKENEGEVIRIATIPSEGTVGYRLYASMAYWNRNIYLIPFTAKSIAIYNIDDGTIRLIKLSSDLMSHTYKFRAYALNGEKLYLFTMSTAAVYSLDLLNDTVSLETKVDEKLIDSAIFNRNEIYFSQQAAVLKDKIYVPFANMNALLVFDFATKKSEFVRLGTEARGYSGIAIQGNDIYLGGRGKNGRCAKWNILDRKLQYLDVEVTDVSGVYFEGKEPIFLSGWEISFVKEIDDYILMFDMNEKQIIYKREGKEEKISTEIMLSKDSIREIVYGGSMIQESQFIKFEDFLFGID